MALDAARGPLGALLAIALLAGLCFPANLHARTRAEIVVPDTLCLPGEEVFVAAFLQRSGLLGRLIPGIQGELLEWFDAEGRRLAARLTDASGHARIAYRPDRPGLASLEVRLAENPRMHAEPVSGRVFVRERDRPLFFVSIEDALREEAQPRGPLPMRLETAGKPLAGAQEALERAQACSAPVYLTTLPRNRLDEIRRWLAVHGFPQAPVLLVESTPDPKEPGRFIPETDLFTSLRSGQDESALLITGNPGLAALAAKAGVTVYLLVNREPSGDDPETPPRIRHAVGWEEVPSPCGL